MRIGLNTSDPQSVSAEQAKKSATTANQLEPTPPTSDHAALAQDKVTLSTLSTQVLGQPELRQGLVDSLRESINHGRYNFDPKAIADAILNR